MWNDDRQAELDLLHELLEATSKLSAELDATERGQHLIAMSSQLARGNLATGRNSFFQFLTAQARDDRLAQAAQVVVRDALDRVQVHPCDYNNDKVKANGLPVELKALYEALAAAG